MNKTIRTMILCLILFIGGCDLTTQSQENPQVQLRSEPMTVSYDDAKIVFGLDDDWRPLNYIDNDFEDRGQVVVDHVTGLMWQKSGSGLLSHGETQAYVELVNSHRFAGYDDWRLPTIPELMSLLEPESPNGLYISPMFDYKGWCWSADRMSMDYGLVYYAWNVSFSRGVVDFDFLQIIKLYVRVVRSL